MPEKKTAEIDNNERTIGSFGSWDLGVGAKEPLPEFVQEYAKDVLTWFNTTQGWQITEVRAGLLDPAQIRHFAEQRVDAPREISPDLLTLSFALKAANPPLRRNWKRQPVSLDLKKIFSPDFEGEVIYGEGNRSADLAPRKIGSSYRLPEALRELSNTFYLSGVLLHLAYDEPYRPNFGPQIPSKEDVKHEPFPKNISMMVILRNLYTRLEQEEAELRTQRNEMAKKLGIEIAKPAAPQPEPAPTKTEEAVIDTKEEVAEDIKTKKTKIEKPNKIKIEPGAYRFSLQDHMWYKDIETGLTRIDEPAVSFSDIGGLAEVKGSLRLLVAGLQNPDLFTKWGTRPPRGVLLYGPPGTGKTMIAKALANEAGIPFFSLQFTDVASRWVHHTAENVKAVLEALDKIDGKKIVFIDEFDNVAVTREEFPPTPGGGSSKKANEILNPLLEYMDGFRSTHNTIFVAATNRKDDVDEAMLRPGRFDRQYNIRTPQGDEILDIYRVQIDKAERDAGRSLFAGDVEFGSLAKLSRGFTGADISEIIRRVLESKVAGELQGEDQEVVTTDNLIAELKVYERRKRETQIGFRPNSEI
ncbi:AAA family ATPase [Candidatus Daviesbacteria bacterium]|nr:AAA family ATPase [Candidatus Daviesbacteria bacterium]